MAKKFTHTVRIYVHDTDYGGIVYHSNYLKYMDEARTEWLEQLGFPLSYFADNKIHFIIRAVEIEYLRPARLDDRIVIESSILRIGKTTIQFSHLVYHPDNADHIYSKSTVTVICINDKIKPIALPKEVIEKLT
jgi:tol-pal system-associated acyl-CoA thioesterase